MLGLSRADRRLQLISDLIWMRLSDNTSSAVAEAAGDGTAAIVLDIPGKPLVAGISLPANREMELGGKQVSFAALLAMSFPDEPAVLAFVEEASGACRMAAIAHGTPVPNMDRHGTLEELLPLARSFLDDHGNARLLARTDHLEHPDHFDLDAFLSRAESQRLLHGARLRPILRGRWRLWLGAALVLLASYLALDHWQSAQEAARIPAAKNIPDEQRYRDALPAAMAAEGLTGSDTRKLVGSLMSMPTTQAGWAITAVQCSVRQCEFLWKRTLATAAFGDLGEAIGTVGLTFAPDQTAIKRQSLVAGARAPITDAMPDEQAAWSHFLSPIQRLGARVSLTVQKGSSFAAGGVSPTTALKRGSVNLRGPIWILELVDQFPDWARVRRLAVHSVGPGATAEIDVVLFMR